MYDSKKPQNDETLNFTLSIEKMKQALPLKIYKRELFGISSIFYHLLAKVKNLKDPFSLAMVWRNSNC